MKFLFLSGIIFSILVSTINAFAFIEDDCSEVNYLLSNDEKCIMNEDEKIIGL